MVRPVVVSILMMLAPGVALAGTPCDKLLAMTIPQVEIQAAGLVAAGTPQIPGLAAVGKLPAFCRVEAVARPVADSAIEFEVWMPESAAWNGKFQGLGNGGYSGALNYQGMAQALRLGYATASHNTGHAGDDMKFGKGHPEKVIDYAYRAVHVMTQNAKLIVRAHLGRFAERSYFVGCSAGGHQALSEAQRYPADYDGIVAGAPANNRIRQSFGFLWSWLALHREDGSPIVADESLAKVTKAVVEACDAADGLKDGLIEDPRGCAVDLSKVLADPAEARAIEKVWAGVKSPRTGAQIFTGWPKGSEDTGAQSWRQYLLHPAEPMRVQLFRYFLFHDPNWDFRTIDWDGDLAYADEALAAMNATNRDLSAFQRRGGKLLLYAGWADPIVPPADTVAYYEGVMQAMGGADKVSGFARLFLAPGMGHCGSGPGPNQFDAVGALDRWVTRGEAPAQLPAKHVTNGVVDRTRPLCPYPQVARYVGSGSIDEAENFRCVSR